MQVPNKGQRAMKCFSVCILITAAYFVSGVQQACSQEPKTIGIVCHCSAELPIYKAFESRLAELGIREGSGLRIVRRFSGSDANLLAANAKEVVDLKPDVIFAGFTPAVIALQKQTSRIPIVFAGVSDASEIGAATHFNHPENNFTGPVTINRELMPKRMELLKEAMPSLTVVGYLANPNYGLHAPQLSELEAAANRLGVKLVTKTVTSPDQFEGAFSELIASRAQALLVQQDPLFTGQAKQVVFLAEKNKIPAIYALRNFYDAGGLIWYGADISALFARAADYVVRILKGEKPSDLPVERPAKLYLTINAKLAQRIGVQLSPSILTRADEVIE
jgi:putative ABC transport system substrate-binding protein